jgi:phosphoserine phosphatase
MIVGAVFFDVDGTLVPGTSSSQFLGERLGHLAELSVAEDEYARGERDNRSVSTLDALGWAGRRPEEVRAWLRELPVVDGVSEVVARCRELGLAPHLATLAWAPVGAHLRETFDFEGSSGPTLLEVDGAYTGEVEHHLDEFGKRDHALRVAEELGLSASSCAAVGDSRSDVPLFAEVGLAIAFNADGAARAEADVEVVGHDLRSVLSHLERWSAGLRSER